MNMTNMTLNSHEDQYIRTIHNNAKVTYRLPR